jgi:transposase, IS30 family
VALGDLGSKRVPEAAREVFLEGVRSGLSRTAAATLAGVSHTTGNRWAKAAGYPALASHHGIRYAGVVREAFWSAVRSGVSLEQAAVDVGVSHTRARIWVKQAGYVLRTPPVEEPEIVTVRRSRAPLTFTERCRLEELLESGCPPARVARRLDRHRDTIRHEMDRGATSSGYRARIGQDVAEANLKRPKARRLDPFFNF